MKRTARVLLALLFVAAAVPLSGSSASAAPTAKTFQCAAGSKPQTCAAAWAIFTGLEAAGLASSDAVVAGMLAAVANGMQSPPDLGECVPGQPTPDPCLVSDMDLQAYYDTLRDAVLRDSALLGAVGSLLGGDPFSSYTAEERAALCLLFPNSSACVVPAGGPSVGGFLASPDLPKAYSGPWAPAAPFSFTTAAHSARWAAVLAVRVDPVVTPLNTWTMLHRSAYNPSPGYNEEVWVMPAVAASGTVPTVVSVKVVTNAPSPVAAGLLTVAVSGWDNAVAYTMARVGESGEAAYFAGLTSGGDTATSAFGGGAELRDMPFSTDDHTHTWAAVEGALQIYPGPTGPTSTQLVEKLGLFGGNEDLSNFDVPPPSPWTDPAGDTGVQRTAPAAVPSQDPAVAPAAPTIGTQPSSSPNTTVPAPANDTETQTNAIAGFFDNLASRIGSSFGWLGDLLGSWITWLLQELAKWFKWLGDGIMDLLRWLGALLNIVIDWLRLIRDALVALQSAMAGLLMSILAKLQDVITAVVQAIGGLGENLIAWLQAIVSAIINLPTTLLNGLQDLLTRLFVPDTLTGLQLRDCATGFPCGWVQEAATAMGELGAGVGAAAGGACTVPAIGWTDFKISLPPPTGCTAAAGTLPAPGAETAGDLFGWRVALRVAALLAFSWFFLLRVLALTPWAEREWYQANPTQQTLFD